MTEQPQVGAKLSQFFGAKRDRLVAALSGCGLVLPQSQGSFFLLIDYGAISTATDTTFADELLTHAGVATIPVSVFYEIRPHRRCCACALPSATRRWMRAQRGWPRTCVRAPVVSAPSTVALMP